MGRELGADAALYLLVVVAVLLAACASSTDGEQSPTSGTNGEQSPTSNSSVNALTSDVFIWGDEDCDGDKDAVDALKALRYVVGLFVSQTLPCPILGNEVVVDGVIRIWGDVD